MTTLQVDISQDSIIDRLGEAAFLLLKDGDDITAVFKDDLARPVKAKVIEKFGPGGGNPFVELKFLDEDHAWGWFGEDYGGEYEEFTLALQ